MEIADVKSAIASEIAYNAADRCVYVIDDSTEMRKSLHFLLSTDDIITWPYAAAEEFLDQLPTLRPGPILLDLRMPGMGGIQALGALRDLTNSWPVIVMTAHGEIAIAVKAMKLGAIEFLEKPFKTEMLDTALAQAFSLLKISEIAEATKLAARKLLDTLSPRETSVIYSLVEGVANKIVAHRLGLSARTVEMHRRNALRKLGLKSVAEVVALVATADLGRH